MTTTMASDRDSAKGARAGTSASRVCTRAATRAPPNTPASTLTKVMPTWTVGRKRSGSSASSRAVAAPGTPLRSMTTRRARRTDTRASSLMANTPLRRMSRMMTTSSSVSPMDRV